MYIPLPHLGSNQYHVTSDDTFRHKAREKWSNHRAITVSPVVNEWAVTNCETGYC